MGICRANIASIADKQEVTSLVPNSFRYGEKTEIFILGMFWLFYGFKYFSAEVSHCLSGCKFCQYYSHMGLVWVFKLFKGLSLYKVRDFSLKHSYFVSV